MFLSKISFYINAALLIDSDALLSGRIPLQLFRPVSRWRKQVLEFRFAIEHHPFRML